MKSTSLNPNHPLSEEKSGKAHVQNLGQVLVVIGFLVIGCVIGWLVFKANQAYTSYQNITRHVAALNLEGDLDPASLREHGRGIALETEKLARAMAPFLPLTPYLGWVPTYGGDIQALPQLLALGRDLGQAVLIFDQIAAPIFDETREGSAIPALTRNLAEADPKLARIEGLLKAHQSAINDLDVARLSPDVAERVAHLQRYLPNMITGVGLARSVPELLGADEPRTYLILTQSNDEIRPTGGYINAAGHMIVDQGKIVDFIMQDSYAVDRITEDYPYPPAPLRQYMASDYWVLRDANWSPDFPTSARTALALYEMGSGISADGVIAFDQQALAYILRSVEPLDIEGEAVTGNNLIPLMRAKWAPEPGQELDEAWWLNRKSFMLALAQGLKQTFESDLDSINMPVLAQALREALNEKHLLVYLTDPAWAEFLEARNWTGELVADDGDYLMVVDANVGFNKASAIVEQQLSYQVALTGDGAGQAHVNLRYKHPADKQSGTCLHDPRYDPTYEQNMVRCYWDYVRLIVPGGVKLIGAPHLLVDGQYLLRGQATTGQLDVELVAPHKVSWGQLFLLPPSETISMDYIYTLPEGTAKQVDGEWHYSLYLQKQPGTHQNAVEVAVTLPAGGQWLAGEPAPTWQEDRTLFYHFDLKQDQEIDISYRISE